MFYTAFFLTILILLGFRYIYRRFFSSSKKEETKSFLSSVLTDYFSPSSTENIETNKKATGLAYKKNKIHVNRIATTKSLLVADVGVATAANEDIWSKSIKDNNEETDDSDSDEFDSDLDDLDFTPFVKKEKKHASIKNVSIKNVSIENISVENASVENVSVKNTSVENTSVEHASVERASVEHASVEHASVEHASVEHASVEHASVENASVEHASVEHASVEQKQDLNDDEFDFCIPGQDGCGSATAAMINLDPTEIIASETILSQTQIAEPTIKIDQVSTVISPNISLAFRNKKNRRQGSFMDNGLPPNPFNFNEDQIRQSLNTMLSNGFLQNAMSQIEDELSATSQSNSDLL